MEGRTIAEESSVKEETPNQQCVGLVKRKLNGDDPLPVAVEGWSQRPSLRGRWQRYVRSVIGL